MVSQLDYPRYNYAEADHLAGAPQGTARRWLTDYRLYSEAVVESQRLLTQFGYRDSGVASFLDLIEVAAVGRLKGIGLSFRHIREIVQVCQEFLDVPRPLIDQSLKAEGNRVFLYDMMQRYDDIEANLLIHHLVVGRSVELQRLGRRIRQQIWSETLRPFLEDLDYRDRLAHRWWPLGRERAVLIDPDYGFGLPVIAGSGVRTEIILEQFQAGESTEQIAEDFDITPQQVEQALRFEMQRAA